MQPVTSSSNYCPENLLDALAEKLGVKSDAGLSRVLDISPSTISRMRHRRIPIYPAILIRMNEISGLSIMELRALAGDRRTKPRPGLITVRNWRNKQTRGPN